MHYVVFVQSEKKLVRKVILRESMEACEVFKTCNLFTVDTNILSNMVNYVINLSNDEKHQKHFVDLFK